MQLEFRSIGYAVFTTKRVWSGLRTSGACLIVAAASFASDATPLRPYLNLDAAEAGLAACKEIALKEKWNLAIAVYDRGGRPIAFSRMDDVFQKQIEVALLKAETASTTPLSSKELGEIAFAPSSALAGIEHAPGLMLVAGGVPIILEGYSIGGVGVSGSTPANDEFCAKAASDAIKEWQLQ